MFEKLLEKIKAYDTIVIHGHINPDGDCFGSQIALRDSLRIAFPNKQIFAVGSGLSNFFNFIGYIDTVDDQTIKSSLAILLDANDLTRMEDQRIVYSKDFIKIDHHIDNNSFKEGEFVVDSDSDSTCSLILSFLLEAKLPLNETICNALLLGIITDTGRFQFTQDYCKTFKNTEILCKYGANPKKILEILNLTDERSLAFKGYYLNHYRKSDSGVIWIALSKEELQKCHVTTNEASNLINIISNVAGYPIWASFCEYPNGKVRCEFRSTCYNVQQVALSIGGGGHMCASGATIDKFDFDEFEKIINKLGQILNKEG